MALQTAAPQELAQRRLYHRRCVYVLIELFVEQVVIHLLGREYPAYAQAGKQHLGKAARVYDHALGIHRLERGIAFAAKAQFLVKAVFKQRHAVLGAHAQHLAAALHGHVYARRVLVCGHAVDQCRALLYYLALQHVRVHALRVQIDRAYARHAAFQNAYHAVVRGRFREHARVFVHQHARDQFHRLTKAVHYNQFLAVGVYALLPHIGQKILP